MRGLGKFKNYSRNRSVEEDVIFLKFQVMVAVMLLWGEFEEQSWSCASIITNQTRHRLLRSVGDQLCFDVLTSGVVRHGCQLASSAAKMHVKAALRRHCITTAALEQQSCETTRNCRFCTAHAVAVSRRPNNCRRSSESRTEINVAS